jgi:hypothetical protein
MAAKRVIVFLQGPNDVTKIININEIPTWSLFNLSVTSVFPSLVGGRMSFKYSHKGQSITVDCEIDYENALPLLHEGMVAHHMHGDETLIFVKNR